MVKDFRRTKDRRCKVEIKVALWIVDMCSPRYTTTSATTEHRIMMLKLDMGKMAYRKWFRIYSSRECRQHNGTETDHEFLNS